MSTLTMTYWLYNFFYPIALIAMLPSYLYRMLKRGGYSYNFGQRLGLYSSETKRRLLSRDNWSWIHAVSIGEFLVARKLALKLREESPNFCCVLSTTTSTAYALAKKHFQGESWMEVIYYPLDFLPIARRALKLIRPIRIILVEGEVWPNLTGLAHRAGVPLALVNARLSKRSEKRFRSLRRFISPVFDKLDVICVQELDDIHRWRTLGVLPAKISHVGSIKFDYENEQPCQADELRALLLKIGVPKHAPILIAGSTHAGEELLIAQIFAYLQQEIPELFLILAPRHAERSQEILNRLEPLNLKVITRTQLEGDVPNSWQPDILLLNTTGELNQWYHLGSVVFVGKSMYSTGGQNPVEPLMAGNAVVFGPHMENFSAIANLLTEYRACAPVEDEDHLHVVLRELLLNRELRAQLVSNGKRALAKHSGATARTVQEVLALRKKANA